MSKQEETRVSVGGWMGSILLSFVPVVNIVFWLMWAVSAKKPSRRTFAAACLWLTLIAAALCALCVTLWGREILEWARQLNPNLFSEALVP
ncbi:MAG: hypothetical protein IJJ23_10550 [Clostridia bacterium]|nr:hypothetical protein [Clostridia bacterium]